MGEQAAPGQLALQGGGELWLEEVKDPWNCMATAQGGA